MKPKEALHRIKNNATRACAPLLFISILAATGCFTNPTQHEYITIGAIFPLTGDFSVESISMANSIHIAKEEINESGGVLGKKLDLIILNGRGDPDFALQQYETLKEKGATAIICSIHSSVGDVVVGVAVKDGMPVVAPLAIANKGAASDHGSVFYLPHLSSDNQNRLASQFKGKYYSRFYKEPPPIAIVAYISARMLSEAIKKAGSTNNDDIIAAIRANKPGTGKTEL